MLGNLFHSPRAAATANWFGIFGGLSAVFGVLAKITPEWFGELTWPQTILAGIVMATALLLALSVIAAVSAYAFRRFKPLPSAKSEGSETLPPPELDYPPIEQVEEIRVRIDKLEIEVRSTQGNLREQVKEARDTTKRLDMTGRLTDQLFEKHGEYLELLRSKSDELSLKYGEIDNELKALSNGVVRFEKEFQEHIEQTRRSFGTLQQRETLELCQREIMEKSAVLYDQLKAGENYDELEWAEWEAVHREWLSAMQRWIDNARFYHRGLQNAILQTNDEQYRGEWTVKDGQFPNAEAVRTFKQHRIRQRQWEEIKEIVDKKIRQVAFVGLSESEVSAND